MTAAIGVRRSAPRSRARSRKRSTGARSPILIFDGTSGRPIDLDFRGTVDDVLARLPPADNAPATPLPRRRQPSRAARGRPKLGVVAREITLLPRHWEWLAQQPGGASVAMRKLVEEARRASGDKDRIRAARMRPIASCPAMAGNKPHFEEAIRALVRGRTPARFEG